MLFMSGVGLWASPLDPNLMPDQNKYSFADAYGIIVASRTFSLELGESCDDLLKCSNLRVANFHDCKVLGNPEVRENAIDLNRFCEHVTFTQCCIKGGNQAGIVIKGASSDISFINCWIARSAKSWTDVLVDDWSDQSQEASTRIDLRGLTMGDGSKVRVVFGRWKKPLMNENQRILWIPTIGLHAYNIGKGLWTWITRSR